MSLSSAKAKLDAQGGDPVTGYISKTDHKESYDELLDDTALTGATTAEALDVAGALTAGTVASDATVAGTGLAGGLLSSANPVINGVAAPGTSAIPSRQDHVHASDTTKVTGPASATDNALVRFDGAGGKTVQNSGITVDDSGNVSSNLTISKSVPVVRLENTSGSGKEAALLADNSGAAFVFDDAGEFYIMKNTSAGIMGGSPGAGTALLTTTAAGVLRLEIPGSAGGIQLGSSGPRVMSGTGSPEGVVTAPVGSRWIRTDGATLGDFEYQKRSGTGSTGWVVADGDTGSRNISASLENGWTGNVYLRRIGNTVELKGEGLNASLATSDTFYTLPTGFRANGSYPGTNRIGLAAAGSAMPSTRVTTGYSTGVTQIVSRGTTTNWDTGTMSWLTANAWPTVLPGA